MQLSLPYTAEVLTSFIAGYHDDIWPVQIIAGALAVLVMVLIMYGKRGSHRLIGCVLALFWLWCGVVFYYLRFADISFLADGYAAAFVLQALLLVWHSALRNRVNFSLRRDMAAWAGLALVVIAALIYPGIMYMLDGSKHSLRLIGVTPVATTLFTIGVLLMAEMSYRRRALITAIPVFYLLASGFTHYILWYRPG